MTINLYPTISFHIQELLNLNRVIRQDYYSRSKPFQLYFDVQKISINPGRMTGKTTFIMNNLKPGDLVLVNNYGGYDNYQEMLGNQTKINPKSIMIYQAEHILAGVHVKPNNHPFNIWWDDYSYSKLTNDEKYSILKPLLKNQYQTFILMG